MDVLLVNPHYNGRSEIPPLGLEYLAAVLMEHTIEVGIVDLDILSLSTAYELLLTQLNIHRPKIIGVTALSNSFESALDVCHMAKDTDPEMLTVMGGIHPTILFDSILRNNEDVDVIVRGEGEYAFLETIQHFCDGLPLSTIEGISFRDGATIAHNTARAMRRDLDSYPLPAHSLVANDDYKTRSISSSRGCFHTCSFCSIQTMYHNIIRRRSVESIVKEIEVLITCGAKRIMFTDDNFTFGFKRVKQLCHEIVRHGFNEKAVFYAEGRIDDVCNAPIIPQILSGAGFRGLYVGAESGSKEILDYYRKNITPDDIHRGVSHCVEQNLTPVVNFILFGPRDTVETIKQTINLAKRLYENGAEIVYAETLTPYPGTPIKEDLEKDGKFLESQGIFYFESYHDLSIDRILLLLNAARDMTSLLHRNDPFYETRKTYFELSYLDNLLDNVMPSAFREMYSRHDREGSIPQVFEQVYQNVINLIH